MTELFDAIFAYYVLVLGAGAFNGARATLRGAGVDPEASGDGSGSLGSGDRSPLAERGHALGARVAGIAQALRRSPRARFVAGWASGARVYRTGRRGAQAVADRVVARRTVPPTAFGPTPAAIVDPATGAGPTGPGAAPGNATARDTGDGQGPQTPADTTGADTAPATPQTTPDTTAEAPPVGDGNPDALDALMRVVTDPTAARVDPGLDPHSDPIAPALPSGRPRLTLVPPIKEYPEMPAADITDLESLIGFTGQAASTAGMESEDSIAAAASTIAAAEFSGETARRVDDEIQTVEMAISTMSVLNVDAETAAAYHRLHEAGGVYRELANTFAAGCQDLAGIAANMATAASGYHEAAVSALDTVNTHQLPHAEAALATGHGGADGQFYGVESTASIAPATSVPALN